MRRGHFGKDHVGVGFMQHCATPAARVRPPDSAQLSLAAVAVALSQIVLRQYSPPLLLTGLRCLEKQIAAPRCAREPSAFPSETLCGVKSKDHCRTVDNHTDKFRLSW